MVKEEYVSFETAKLLKEKGFDVPQIYLKNYFKGNAYRDDDSGELFVAEKDISVPTQALAMRWLREVHKLFIEIIYGVYNNDGWHIFDIYPINDEVLNFKQEDVEEVFNEEYPSYEEACEAAIKFCLEKLI